MTAPTLKILTTKVRRDADGRYCLNDCHKAAGGDNAKRPSLWAENAQTKSLIAELEGSAGIPAHPLSTVTTGPNETRGTFVAKELVYAYAMWISPAFHLMVIRAFDAMVSGHSHPDRILTKEQKIAEAFLLLHADHEELKEEVAVMSPKAAVYDACMNLDGVYGLQQSGRILRQKPNLFVRHLKTQWLFYQGGQLIPRSEYSMAGQGLFDVKWTVQNEKNIAQTYVTPKGLAYFAKKLGVEIDLSQMGGFPMGSSDGFEQRPN